MSLNIYWCNILIIYSLWKADADLSATAHQPKAATRRSKEGTGVDNIHAGSIKMVMAGSGCENAEKVKQVIIGCLFSSSPPPLFSLYNCSFCQCLYFFFFFFLWKCQFWYLKLLITGILTLHGGFEVLSYFCCSHPRF